MIDFFKNKEKKTTNNNEPFTKIAALMIHAAKIDETYTNEEKEIIKKTLMELGANRSNIDMIVSEASLLEENSNQILAFTKEIKSMAEPDKIRIIKSLWKIIYSDNNSDMYEANLMRRLAGLLYIDPKIMGDLKEEIKRDLSK